MIWVCWQSGNPKFGIGQPLRRRVLVLSSLEALCASDGPGFI